MNDSCSISNLQEDAADQDSIEVRAKSKFLREDNASVKCSELGAFKVLYCALCSIAKTNDDGVTSFTSNGSRFGRSFQSGSRRALPSRRRLNG